MGSLTADVVPVVVAAWAASEAGPLGSCVGPNFGVIGLTGGRVGDDVRVPGETAVEDRRRTPSTPEIDPAAAGWPTFVVIVRPGITVFLCFVAVRESWQQMLGC